MVPVSTLQFLANSTSGFVFDGQGLLAQCWFAQGLFAQCLFAQAPAEPANPVSMLGPLLPLVLLAVAFYFMIWLPQSRERKALEEKLNNIKKNDQVITSGGIVGIVVQASAGAKYLTVRIDDNNSTKIKILRSAIVHVGDVEEEEEKPKKE